MTPARPTRGCVVLIAGCLLAAALLCSLGTVGVRQRAIRLPWFEQTVGPLRVVGYDTWNANCPPYVGCDPTLHEAYVVWLLWGAAGPSQGVYRLLSLPIAHES